MRVRLVVVEPNLKCYLLSLLLALLHRPQHEQHVHLFGML